MARSMASAAQCLGMRGENEKQQVAGVLEVDKAEARPGGVSGVEGSKQGASCGVGAGGFVGRVETRGGERHASDGGGDARECEDKQASKSAAGPGAVEEAAACGMSVEYEGIERMEEALEHDRFTQLAKQQPGWAPAYDGAQHLSSLGPAPEWAHVVTGGSRCRLAAIRMRDSLYYTWGQV